MEEKERSELSAGFDKAWRKCFGKTPPLGYMLRHDFSEHWTRFHSLPGSKRYPVSNEEFAIILHRANTLATECFGEKRTLWVATRRFSDFALKDSELPARMNMLRAMKWIDEGVQREEQPETTFYVSAFDWSPNSLNWLFKEIAEDKERALLFSEDSKTVFAPYDGGFDLISLLSGRIVDLETRYKSWMSDSSDKL